MDRSGELILGRAESGSCGHSRALQDPHDERSINTSVKLKVVDQINKNIDVVEQHLGCCILETLDAAVGLGAVLLNFCLALSRTRA